VDYCLTIPPGDSARVDAYNLMVTAFYAIHGTAGEMESAERLARTIIDSVRDWEEVAAFLAILASQFAGFCDDAMPLADKHGVPYARPTENMRLAIEAEELQPV
jgi:hypothetical protein